MATVNKIGPGPINSANSWSVTRRLDKAGDFRFTMPGADEMASYVAAKRGISVYATLDGSVRYMGGGIVDSISKKADSDGGISMTVAGNDAMRLLTNRTIVGAFQNHDAVDTLATLANFAPGWTFYPDPDWVTNPVNVYMSFAGETVLACVIKLAEKLGAHVWLVGRRELQIQSIADDSGVRAIQQTGDLSNETCAIADLEEVTDSYEMVSRIIPYGAGQGSERLTLFASNRTAPTGYTLNLAENYLRRDAVEEIYYREQRVEFKEIAPIANTDADYLAAANALYDSAKVWLDLNSTEQKSYRLKLVGCSIILRPMQTIRVVYRNDNLDLNDDLLILEATVQGDLNDVRTTDVVVSNLARWPTSDTGALVDAIKQSQILIAHPQANANAYTTGYTKNVDADYNATFRFRFGNEVTTLNQVLFEFQILPLESTVKTIGGTATGTVDIPGHTHTVSISGHTHSVSVPGHTHGVTMIGTTGDPTGSRPFARAVYFDTTDDNFYVDGGGSDQATSTDNDGSSTPTSSSGGSSTPTSASGGDATDIALDISNALEAVYGIFRETAPNTFDIDDLEYSVNGGSWFALNTATVVDTGWYQLDITSLVQNATNLRPNQTSNHLDIRKAAAAASLTATIDALLSVRSGIQAINYQ